MRKDKVLNTDTLDLVNSLLWLKVSLFMLYKTSCMNVSQFQIIMIDISTASYLKRMFSITHYGYSIRIPDVSCY